MVKKPDYVCYPGDARVRKYGWRKNKCSGYISLIEDTVWLSAVLSKHDGHGNLSRLIRNLHKKHRIKVPGPFPRMEAICEHLGFRKTTEEFPEVGEPITVYVLEREDMVL